MNSSTRERWLMIVFPAVMIVIGWWGWLRPTTENSLVARQLAAARASAPPPPSLQNEKTKLIRLNAEVKTLDQCEKQLTLDWDRFRLPHAAQIQRTHQLEELAELFERHGLNLLREEPQTGGGSSGMPNKLTQAFEKLERAADAITPELKAAASGAAKSVAAPKAVPFKDSPNRTSTSTLWQIEFAGNYSNVLAALVELRDSPSPTIPISLSMQKAKTSTSLRRWTLLVKL